MTGREILGRNNIAARVNEWGGDGREEVKWREWGGGGVQGQNGLTR